MIFEGISEDIVVVYLTSLIKVSVDYFIPLLHGSLKNVKSSKTEGITVHNGILLGGFVIGAK